MKKDVKAPTVFRLTKSVGEPLTFLLPTRHTRRKNLTCLDKDKDGKDIARTLRYASNQSSPFEDEQKGEIILEPIEFINGTLTVDWRKPGLLKFLGLHPDNVANGGRSFELMDFAAEAVEQQKQMDLEDEAIDLYKELSLDDIEAVHRLISRDTDKSSNEEIRRDVRVFSRNHPSDFLGMVDRPENESDNNIAKFLDQKLIQFRNKNTVVHYNLKDNKKMLCRIPNGENHIEYLQEFLMENAEIYVELEAELN